MKKATCVRKPNPFNNSTTILFHISARTKNASIVIAQMVSGKIVKTMPFSPTASNVIIYARALATGAFTYSLFIDGKKVDTKQLLLSK